jgi:hypothetical protein
MLTLYTTPVVYLYLDRFRIWFEGVRGRQKPRRSQAPETGAMTEENRPKRM